MSRDLPPVGSLLRGESDDKKGVVLFRVHEYRDGQVYGVRWAEGTDPRESGNPVRVPIEAMQTAPYEVVEEEP